MYMYIYIYIYTYTHIYIYMCVNVSRALSLQRGARNYEHSVVCTVVSCCARSA